MCEKAIYVKFPPIRISIHNKITSNSATKIVSHATVTIDNGVGSRVASATVITAVCYRILAIALFWRPRKHSTIRLLLIIGHGPAFVSRLLPSPATHIIIETNNKTDTWTKQQNVWTLLYCVNALQSEPGSFKIRCFRNFKNFQTIIGNDEFLYINEQNWTRAVVPVHVICVPAPVSPQSSVGNDGCNIAAVFRTHGKQICPP